ncbi:uncharacterized protein LOC142978603 [Anticarsia gemmatalis]|uniref:uncharacterized protein LOC142978603 n=1 Tax=Anticarsia gemmatalis TaxID=129554 RepID=UPI003F7695AD
MCNLSGDYLLTYEPETYEFHSDTTDFEDFQPRVTTKNGNHNLINKKTVYKSSSRDVHVYINTPPCFSRMISDHSQERLKPLRNKEFAVKKKFADKISAAFDSGDQYETIRRKRSVIRHKVIPCISSMFRRPNFNINHMTVIRENHSDSVKMSNYCQPSSVYCKSKTKNYDRNNYHYNVQPVYAMERNGEPGLTSYQQLNINSASYMPKEECCNAQYCLTSSSDLERQSLQKKQERAYKWKKHYENDMPEMESPPPSPCPEKRKRKSHKFLSKRYRKPSYQVFMTPERTDTACGTGNVMSDFSTTTATTVPSTCSGFWDYIFNKINSRYAYHNPEVFRSCNCETNKFGKSKPARCCDNFNLPDEPAIQYRPPPAPKLKPCSCKTKLPYDNPCDVKCEVETPPKARKQGRTTASIFKKSWYKKIDCDCRMPVRPPPPKPPSPPPSPPPRSLPVTPPCALGQAPCPQGSGMSSESSDEAQCIARGPMASPTRSNQSADRPCQLPHDALIKGVTQKYNGEIICIHNPPCVLINGCLNLPKPEPPPATTTCPMFEYSKFSYQTPSQDACSKKIVDQYCQYHGQSTELQAYDLVETPLMMDQYQTTDRKREKIVQSFCSHEPPCEVQRTCKRPKFDPALTSCIHVPMCDNLPMCMLRSSSPEQSVCRHNPKCANVPTCTRDRIALTASEEVATQVRLKTKTVCRHEPPCINIPKCVARACTGSYFPYDAVPDCVHQPTCEMIPACCRKSAKEMVSVCSQHPNSCRIV